MVAESSENRRKMRTGRRYYHFGVLSASIQSKLASHRPPRCAELSRLRNRAIGWTSKRTAEMISASAADRTTVGDRSPKTARTDRRHRRRRTSRPPAGNGRRGKSRREATTGRMDTTDRLAHWTHNQLTNSNVPPLLRLRRLPEATPPLCSLSTRFGRSTEVGRLIGLFGDIQQQPENK